MAGIDISPKLPDVDQPRWYRTGVVTGLGVAGTLLAVAGPVVSVLWSLRVGAALCYAGVVSLVTCSAYITASWVARAANSARRNAEDLHSFDRTRTE